MHPFLAHEGVIPFAHRGGASAYPENTIKAFQAAFDLGFRHLETDVHLSKDGVLYAFHDNLLDRVTDQNGKISELTASEIDKARVQGTEPIPRLADLLTQFPEAKFNIDPKCDEVVSPLGDLIERMALFDRVCVTSFLDHRQARLRARFGSRLCTGMGRKSIARMVAASLHIPVGRFEERCAQVPVRAHGIEVVTPRFIRACHQRGIAVHVWTIDDPREMQRLVLMGVDGIMTDQPEVLLSILNAEPTSHRDPLSSTLKKL